MTMSSLHLLLQQQTPKWHVLTCVCECVCWGTALLAQYPRSLMCPISHIACRQCDKERCYIHSLNLHICGVISFIYVRVCVFVVRVVVECTSYSGYVRSCYAFFCLVLGSLVLTTSVVIIMQPLLFPFLVPRLMPRKEEAGEE